MSGHTLGFYSESSKLNHLCSIIIMPIGFQMNGHKLRFFSTDLNVTVTFYSVQGHMKVLLMSLYKNGHTLGLHPQT